MKKKAAFLLITLLLNGSSIFAQIETNITILPDNNVEVGEAVHFDANYYRNIYGIEIQCEWDFDNGYAMRAAESGMPFDTGPVILHHFMKPGEYHVKLAVSRFDMSQTPPVRQELLAQDSILVIVTGEEIIEGFELRHAPFHARIAQHIYALVPPQYNPSQVTMKVERTDGNYSREVIGITEDDKQKFLLQNASLPAGDYILTAALNNGSEIISTIKEKFSKPYDGAPETGINENNSFVLNGTDLFFPISPYMLNTGNIPLWQKLSNTLHTVGWYPEHTPETWTDYIQQGNNYGLKSIGPSRWKGLDPGIYRRNARTDSLKYYVQQIKDTPGLMGWNWYDEPNLGGRYRRVPGQVITAWTYLTNVNDPHKPAGQQYYGYDYLSHYNPRSGNHEYSFMRSANAFGGKKTFTGNFLTYDIYPINYKGHYSLTHASRGVIDLWLEGINHFKWNTAELIPLGMFIETQNVTSHTRMSEYSNWSAGPVPGDIRTQLWGAVIHGMKMIHYFQYFSPTPADNMSVMAEFKEAVTALTPVILAEESAQTVTHNANQSGRRVDHMVRETETDIYIFAARITEPESEWDKIHEPLTIEVAFNINNVSINHNIYDDFPLYKWEHLTLDAAEGQTEFNFSFPHGAVLPNTFIVSAVREAKEVNGSAFLNDRWTGKAYYVALDHPNNLKYGYDDGNGTIISLSPWGDRILNGTIHYEMGEVNLRSDHGIPEGEGFIQAAYAPSNRNSRAIPAVEGVFTDILERNAVRIYRIPKTSVGIDDSNMRNMADQYILNQNYPNPFNPATSINYQLATAGYVSLKIYDILGREVATIIDGIKPAGTHTAQWDGKNHSGHSVTSGIYFYRLSNESGFTKTKKMIFMK